MVGASAEKTITKKINLALEMWVVTEEKEEIKHLRRTLANLSKAAQNVYKNPDKSLKYLNTCIEDIGAVKNAASEVMNAVPKKSKTYAVSLVLVSSTLLNALTTAKQARYALASRSRQGISSKEALALDKIGACADFVVRAAQEIAGDKATNQMILEKLKTK